MDVKIRVEDENIVFYVPDNGIDHVLCIHEKSKFQKLLPKEELDKESEYLRSRFKTISAEEKPADYFENIITILMESYMFQSLDKVALDNERLKSFLVYHIKTLRSIKKHYNNDLKQGNRYVAQELYNMTNMTVDDLFKILDTITAKRGEKNDKS